MARFHLGRLDHPGAISFVYESYWYKGEDDDDFRLIKYPQPTTKTRQIRRMYGFSIWGVFVGVITFGK